MSNCRSCGAAIKWVVMAGGKAMPLDALPCEDGNIVEGDDGRFAVAVAIRKSDRPRYKSHFTTCPNAAKHRKPKGTKADEPPGLFPQGGPGAYE